MIKQDIHNPPHAFHTICDWYEKSVIDYRDHFIPLYVAYNTWCREATGEVNDRKALSLMKKRYVIWEDYTSGKTLKGLESYMQRLVDVTQKDPLNHSSLHWSGEIENIHDYRGLIELWYQVRCLLVHGSKVQPIYVWLAYETLDIFMREIIKRTRHYLRSSTYRQVSQTAKMLSEIEPANPKFIRLQQKLYQNYVALPDIWHVDMQQVTTQE